MALVLVYTQEGSLWSIVLRCDDHTGIFTCDGCARDPYFYVPAETQSYVIKLSCSRRTPKSLPPAGIEPGTFGLQRSRVSHVIHCASKTQLIAGNIYCPGCKTEIVFTKLISLHPPF